MSAQHIGYASGLMNGVGAAFISHSGAQGYGWLLAAGLVLCVASAFVYVFMRPCT